MTRFLHFVTKSITRKVILAICLLIISGVGVSWYVLITSGKNNLIKNAINYTASYSDLIKKSVHYDMLTFHREALQNTIENMSSRKDIEKIRIFDGRGKIFYSSHPQEINQLVDKSSTACAGCHSDPAHPSETLTGNRQWQIYTGKDRHRVLVFVEPLYNEPSCYSAACHVHPQSKRILGILETEFSLSSVDEGIHKQIVYTIFYAVGFIGIMSVIVGLFLWRFVHRPVSVLSKGMKRVAEGDLTHRVEVTSQDEMGLLAGTFNMMIEELQKTTVSRDLLAEEVDERKRIEEQLRASERFVATAFDSIRDPFIILDRDYRIVRANEAYSNMRNIPLKDLLGEHCYKILYSKEGICKDCIVAKTFLSTDPCAKDKLIRLPDGTESWFEIYTYPVSDDRGKVTHVIEYLRDITDRKRAQEATKRAYAELDQIFNTAADGMCVIDNDFTVLRVNKTFLDLFGLSRDEAVGKKCYDIFPGPECNTPFCPFINIAGSEAGVLKYESEKKRKDGQIVPFSLTATAYRGPDGELMGIVEDFKDISVRKRMEEELRSQSVTDELTGIYNRRGLFTLAGQELRMANRMKRGIFLLYADLDGLKAVNDTFGHEEGDRAIVAFADILKTTYRESDIIARIGGDEFVVIPIGVSGDNVETIISRLQRNIDGYNTRTNLAYRLSASVGVAYYDPEHPCTFDDLLLQGDRIMYEQKRAKRKP